MLIFFPVEISNLYDNPDNELVRTRSSFSTLTLRKKGKYMSAWNIVENFTFRVSAMCRLNCDSTRNVEVIFHYVLKLKTCFYFFILDCTNMKKIRWRKARAAK